MFTVPVVIMLLALPLLLIGSGFFSGSETALFSLSRHDRLKLERDRGITATAIRSLLSDTRGLLITLLLSNMTINVVYIVLSTVVLLRLSEHTAVSGMMASALSVAPLILLILVGEVLPKLIASRTTVTFARLASVPLLVAHRLLGPLRAVLNVIVITPLARLIAPATPSADLTSTELETLLTLSQTQGLIDRREEHLLQQVLMLSQLRVRELMTHRTDIESHDLSKPPEALVNLVTETRLSRIPVCIGDVDHIEGVVFARQVLLKKPRTQAELKPLIRRVIFVPEILRADRLLVHFRKTGTTFAIAVDEYGGTAGLITIEDLVEALVGPIAGPYESSSEPHVQAVSPGVWRVGSDLPLHEWKQVFGGLIGTTDLKTIGGLVMARLGRVPRPGDQVIVGNVRIEIEQMDGVRMESLLLRLISPNAAPETTPEAQP